MFAEQAAGNALNQALFGYVASKVAKILPSDRFAHYTSRSVVDQIIQGDQDGKRYLWLCNSRFMNDFTEVEWGKWCLNETLKNWRLDDRFKRVLDAIRPGVHEQIKAFIAGEHQELGANAYLTSLTLHNEKECLTGKLSMWRAYGRPENACLIFNTAPFLNPQNLYETVLSPVMYGGPVEFSHEFEAMVYRLEQQVHLLRVVDAAILSENLKRAITFAILSMKHSGFNEETEWRVIHQHSDLRPDPPSIVDPNDPAKTVYLIPIENRPDAGIWGADLDEVLDRIIVGPVKHVQQTVAHYIDRLYVAGVRNPNDRVRDCGIPYRHKGRHD